MKRKLTVIVYYRVTGVRAALKAYDYIRVRGKHIGYLALALIAPAGAYYCFYHSLLLLTYTNLNIYLDLDAQKLLVAFKYRVNHII